MPVYVFECPKCKFRNEVQARMSDFDRLVKKAKCPRCKSKTKNIIEGRPLISFHGAGWSKDGYGITQREMNKNIEDGCKADPTCIL